MQTPLLHESPRFPLQLVGENKCSWSVKGVVQEEMSYTL